MGVEAYCQGTARPKNAAATRDAILAAARARFLEDSYDSVGLRDIASDAGVDVALVSRYFGGKEKLFVEVLGKKEPDWLPPGTPAAELPTLLTTLFMNHDEAEHREHAEYLLIILRSASSPKAAEIVRDALRGGVLEPLAACLDGEDADARASLAMAVWMGATMLRTIMTVEPLNRHGCEVVGGRLAALYEAALREAAAGGQGHALCTAQATVQAGAADPIADDSIPVIGASSPRE